ncbi:hypothetical protein V5O48_009890 [Marasmius crinis-equi]|uniref:Uncharacterized protein n=1 Tax=Marasmius crinis-equi TaxID=585013 RepID=A0ABR3FA05_9AGAR
MPFPFTFNFSVPGLSNPFSPPPLGPPSPPVISGASTRITRQPNMNSIDSETEEDILNIGPGSSHLSPRLPSPQRTSRKRGWEPSYPEQSRSKAQTTLASSTGYLDTPSKYREMAEGQPEEAFQYIQTPGTELDDALQPPAKRRRGLAGSIVSTALSAALIGTAVGLTVYRLWRDRGKGPEPMAIAHEQHPPPPYSETDSQPQASSSSQPSSLPSSSPNLNVIPPTPQRKQHPHKVPRSTPRRRRAGPSRAANLSFTPSSSSSNALFPVPKPEFDFSFQSPSQSSSHQQPEVEDQMDWIGDKLSMLIEEGKRALGKEIVVASESAQDEVDDGRGGWVEDDDELNAGGRGRSSSPRRVKRKGSHRRMTIRHSPSSSYSQPATPLLSSTFSASQSMDSTAHCESPELKDSMEKARRKVLEARAARASASPFS